MLLITDHCATDDVVPGTPLDTYFTYSWLDDYGYTWLSNGEFVGHIHSIDTNLNKKNSNNLRRKKKSNQTRFKMSTDNIVCIQNKDWNFITAVWAWMACRTRTSRSPWCRGTRGKSPATNQTRRINKSFGQQMKRVHQYPRVTNQQSWFPAILHLSSIQAWHLSLDD